MCKSFTTILTQYLLHSVIFIVRVFIWGVQMKPDKIEVGKRIKTIKETYKPPISLSDFGELLIDEKGNRLSKGTVNSWMRGLALPPVNLVEQIAKLGDTTTDWIYWGSLNNYIQVFLMEYKYEKLLNEKPEVQIALKEKLENLGYNDEKLPPVSFISQVFQSIYSRLFNEYINEVCSPYVEQISNYLFTGISSEGSEEVQKLKFLMRIKTKIENMSEDNKFVWGEKDRIEEIANEQLEEWIRLYNQSVKDQFKGSETVLKYLIERTKDKEGIEKLLSELATFQRGKLHPNIKLTDTIIEVFVEFGERLEKLMQKEK